MLGLGFSKFILLIWDIKKKIIELGHLYVILKKDELLFHTLTQTRHYYHLSKKSNKFLNFAKQYST